MRALFQNTVFVRLSAIAALIGLAVLAWALLVPSPSPALSVQLEDARTLLRQARDEGVVQPLDYTIRIPADDSVSTQERKVLFMAKMLPLITAENARIAKRRRTLLEHSPGTAQLNALGQAYGLGPDHATLGALLKRVDTLPVSLVLAQAAIESAWGTSRFAQDGNAYFGERTFDAEAPGLEPKRASGFKVKSFESAQLSVRSYLRTLNTHPAYKALRRHRAELRQVGQKLSGAALAHDLKDYSEIGQTYIALIEETIAHNQLSAFDKVRIAQR